MIDYSQTLEDINFPTNLSFIIKKKRKSMKCDLINSVDFLSQGKMF